MIMTPLISSIDIHQDRDIRFLTNNTWTSQQTPEQKLAILTHLKQNNGKFTDPNFLLTIGAMETNSTSALKNATAIIEAQYNLMQHDSSLADMDKDFRAEFSADRLLGAVALFAGRGGGSGGGAKPPQTTQSGQPTAASPATVMNPSVAANNIVRATRTGSALKNDPYHRAGSYLSETQLAQGQTFQVVSGDGVSRTLLQVRGNISGKGGVFEFILGPNNTVTHQRFIPGGVITGYPNQTLLP